MIFEGSPAKMVMMTMMMMVVMMITMLMIMTAMTMMMMMVVVVVVQPEKRVWTEFFCLLGACTLDGMPAPGLHLT
jgi:Zn-dependent protease with chaperone function